MSGPALTIGSFDSAAVFELAILPERERTAPLNIYKIKFSRNEFVSPAKEIHDFDGGAGRAGSRCQT